MKKISILFFLCCSAVVFAQEYSFVPKHYVRIDKWKYIEFLNKTPKPEVDYRLENGKNYTKAYQDSINKTKDAYRLTSIHFSDSIANKAIVVLKMRTEAEMKLSNEEFYEFQENAKKNRKKLTGSTVSDLQLTDILGKHYSLGSLTGKMIVLNFWFTKCAPCVKEMPDLNKLKEKYGTEDVSYFAVTYDNIDLVERFLTRQQLDFTVIPNDKKTIDSFGISFYPTNILIDQQGKVLYVSEFFNPKSNNGLKEIEKLIRKHTKKT
jgi:thiol-disulfide isomerase/thioredoxin